MARKQVRLTIEAEGRDKGKIFVLDEMPASRVEKWAARALLAMGRAGVQVPDNVASAGLAGIAMLGIKALAGMAFEDAEPLLDEMFECVRTQPDPARTEVVRKLVEDDIEEVATRIYLRAELFALHTGFSAAAIQSKLGVAATVTEGAPS